MKKQTNVNEKKTNKHKIKIAAKPISFKFSSGVDFAEWALVINSIRAQLINSLKVKKNEQT